MALRKCACIDTLYTELDWLDRFQAAKNDGFEAVEFWDWRIRDLDATREAAEFQSVQVQISQFSYFSPLICSGCLTFLSACRSFYINDIFNLP